MADLAIEGADGAGMSDQVIVELNGETVPQLPDGVKGPDAAVWGDEQTRPPSPTSGLGVDPNVKGPDPAVWGTDEERQAAATE